MPVLSAIYTNQINIIKQQQFYRAELHVNQNQITYEYNTI